MLGCKTSELFFDGIVAFFEGVLYTYSWPLFHAVNPFFIWIDSWNVHKKLVDFCKNWHKVFQSSKVLLHTSYLIRVSVQGVKSLGDHFACLCRRFEFYEVKKKICYYFSKRKLKYFYTFYHFYSEKSSKKAK